jgi:hypothetical protein
VVTDDRVQVMVRLPRSLVKEIDHLAVDLDLFRGEAMALLLIDALDARRARTAEREE